MSWYIYHIPVTKNGIINKQSAKLQVLNKEIHRRVKNNLQVISSMLNLQSQTRNDEKASAMAFSSGFLRYRGLGKVY